MEVAGAFGSKNYFWTQSSKLGSGATGTVYRGVHIETMKPVAIKVFEIIYNMSSEARKEQELVLFITETDVLMPLKHENIVQFLGVEDEITTGKKVMIMELCDGGSLADVLQEPENTFGFSEIEFLRALKHLASAWQYFRMKNLIHRDIKPANIVKCIGPDGSLYKIIDFGGGRLLNDNEEHQSLSRYGTALFLHPELFYNIFFERPKMVEKTTTYKLHYELWSIGVTLYVLATGSSPFRSLNGSSDIVYHMMTKKEFGKISAVEVSPNNIVYKDKFPETCNFSSGLKRRLVPMLAHLMESDPKKRLTFENFFEDVNDITSQCVIYVFYLNGAKEITLYLPPNNTLVDVKKEISIQVGIEPSKQCLIFHNTTLDSVVNASTEIRYYPQTSSAAPLNLLHIGNLEIIYNLPKCNENEEALFAVRNQTFRQEYMIHAWYACSIGHSGNRNLKQKFYSLNTLLKLPYTLISLSTETLSKLTKEIKLLESRKNDLGRRVDLLEKGVFYITYLLKKCQSAVELSCMTQIIAELRCIKSQVDEKFLRCKNLQQYSFESLKSEWDGKLEQLRSSRYDNCIEQGDEVIHSCDLIWKNMLKRQKTMDERHSSALNWEFRRSQAKLLENITLPLEKFGKNNNNFLAHFLKALKIFTSWYKSYNDVKSQLNSSEDLPEILESYSSKINEGEQRLLNLVKSAISDFEKSDLSAIEIISLGENSVTREEYYKEKINEFCSSFASRRSSYNFEQGIAEDNDELRKKMKEETDKLNAKLLNKADDKK